MNPIRVLLVDDHQIVRQGLRAILDPDERFIVVGEAVSGAEALALAGAERPDVVVLDLMLADMGGAEVCQRLLAAFPDMAVSPEEAAGLVLIKPVSFAQLRDLATRLGPARPDKSYPPPLHSLEG